MAKKPIKEHVDGLLSNSTSRTKRFQLEFLTESQRLAWEVYNNNQIAFMIGAAGTGKSFLSMAFACQEVMNKQKEKIIISRPIVEAGERLGFLPGDLNEKVEPYMAPLYDCLTKICGKEGEGSRKYIQERIEVKPLAFMRGCTFDNAVCILDEAQNCTRAQLKLFLSRIGANCRMVITGDPTQSDLTDGETDILRVVRSLEGVDQIGAVHFSDREIVRNPIIGEILRRL